MVSKYYKIRNKSGGSNSIKPFQLYRLAFGLFLNSAIQIILEICLVIGDHCVLWGCDKDRRYPEKQKILPHVGIFYSPRNNNDVLS